MVRYVSPVTFSFSKIRAHNKFIAYRASRHNSSEMGSAAQILLFFSYLLY